MNNVVLVTGISGQDGSYLAKILLDNNYKVIGLVRDKNNINISRLEYLNISKKIIYEECKLETKLDVIKVLEKYNPETVYNLASQSSVGLSYSKPYETLYFNINSVISILDAIRIFNDKIKFFQASSSEIFGVPDILPVNEESKIMPVNSYGTSKASTHFIIKNYRSTYNMFISSAIFFNHESVLRGEQFVVKKIIRDCVKISQDMLLSLNVGNIDVKRDFGYAPKYMEAVFLMMNQKISDDYIISTGVSLSIREIINYVFMKLNIDQSCLNIDPDLYRIDDVPIMYGSNSKITEALPWSYDIDFYDVIDEMILFEQNKYLKAN